MEAREELTRMPSRSVSRQASGRQFERSKSILNPGQFLKSNSMILRSEEVTVAPPSAAEPLALGFEALPLLDLRPHDLLPQGPTPAHAHGVLPNGLRFFVRRNPKPRDRAALALAVSVGSIVEEDGEQGVAHIVEHLAFSATKDYSNHDLVHFLESIGSQFGPCQNAHTSFEETVYEIQVPVDRPEILSQSLHVLAEFSSEIRASEEDLEKERGAVLEEWRKRRNAAGRLSDAYWKVLMEGSKYADRSPIGEEEVIKTVPAQRVRDFYHTWYQPQNMAVIAVGDFSDVEEVVKLINDEFAAKKGHTLEDPSRSLTVPTFPVPPHDAPRFSCYVDPESQQSAVSITCKAPRRREIRVEDKRFSLATYMFHALMNLRFFRISNLPDRPFYGCTGSTDDLGSQVTGNSVQASCPEGGTLQALERILIELARVRLHGFTEREIGVARAELMVMIKSTYLQKDQQQSKDWRDEFVKYFLLGDSMGSIEYEVQFAKTFAADMTAEEISKIAEYFSTTASCTIKTIECEQISNEEQLKAIVAKVAAMEAQGEIDPWDEQSLPDLLVKEPPTPGVIVETKDIPEFDATEVTLSNGIRVCYKCTDFLDNQILIRGFAYGGVSEVAESDFSSCKMGELIAAEVGQYGHKLPILLELLAGKMISGNAALGYYTRSFEAESSTSDLDTALQLLHQLFVTRVEPSDTDVKVVMQETLESIKASDRDPTTEFYDKIRSVNLGDSHIYEPLTATKLSKVDPKVACEFFNDCYSDPSSFIVVVVGDIDTEAALPLMLKYLGGIPKPEKPVMNYNRENLTVVPVNPTSQIIREEVRKDMVEATCEVYLSFPIHLHGPNVGTDMTYTDFMCKFLETKILQVLRFKHGKVYNASVSAFMGGSNPFFYEEIFGYVAVNFSCDPDVAWELVDLTLEEIKRLQEEEKAPVSDDVETVLELEQREYENFQEDNEYWVDRLGRAYRSPIYSGDLGSPLKEQDELREAVRADANTDSMQVALRRILPLPCTNDYKAVVLLPKDSNNESANDDSK